MVSLLPKVGSLRKHRVVVAMEPIDAGNTRKRSLALGKVPRCCGRARAVPPRSAFGGRGGWFVGAGPEFRPNNADVEAGEVGVHFPFPGRFGESRPMRLVKHHDDATSPYRMMTGDLLHLQPLEGGRNVV